MKLIIEENEKAMSESAMQIILGAMQQDKRVNISLTAGKSPKMLYQMMIPYVRDQKNIKIFNIIFLMKHHILVKRKVNQDQTG